ncbi:MAG: Methionine-binding lipoprotein MetQ [Chlamydiales bacterium]|nr:Methionine-binding lipoprotein MetQ [Chlamydiales bacterium]MCH9620159.1 Methionine-binding lipoprotein MetQ [Chlamydiales bacterium]MCH9623629.1 Methionine-binding lipoprotein MetQ [Chlamydiales bacterium]
MFCLLLLLIGCNSQEKTLKIAATSTPHAEILRVIAPNLKERGIKLKVIEVDDYAVPNRLLAEKQVDANFFQHRPFLEDQKRRFGYEIKELAKVHFEPLGIYSKKIQKLDQIKEGSLVAIPSDPTNESRALELLAFVGLIDIKKDSLVTVHDILRNPLKLRIEEIDAPFLPRTLKDVTIAVIPSNFALLGGLDPKTTLATEKSDSPYANIIAIREGDHREEIIALQQEIHSSKVKEYIIETYQGVLQPTF